MSVVKVTRRLMIVGDPPKFASVECDFSHQLPTRSQPLPTLHSAPPTHMLLGDAG